MKTLCTLMLTFLFPAFAQGPMPPQPGAQQPPRMQQPQPQQSQPRQSPNFEALKSYLNLTDGQIRQMQQAREKAAKEADEKMKSLRPQIDEKHRALADLLDKDNADALTVGRAMLEVRGLERQLRQAHEAVRNSEVNVMTAEQKVKFKAIQDAAMLPEATREAQRLGLVPGMGIGGQESGAGGRPGPNGQMPMQPMPNGPGPRRMGPGQGPMMQPPPNPPMPPRQGGEVGGR